MTDDLRFRTDLYRGTATYYDRFRPPYPDALLTDLRARLGLSGTGGLLDLGAGTGQIAFPLADAFGRVVAVDQEAETVNFGRAKAAERGIDTMTWVTGDAESVEVEGRFELVAMGNSFHRMDRVAVAERATSAWLVPGGAVALLWGGSPTYGELPWQRTLEQLVIDWTTELGVIDRIPAGWERAMRELPHEEVLERAGLDYLGKFEFSTEETWSLETVAGYWYSTSLLSKEALGDRVDDFERDLADRLSTLASDGILTMVGSYSYEAARLT